MDDPSRASYDGLVAVIAEELYTRVMMGPTPGGDQIEPPEDAKHFAEIIASALLHRFKISEP